MSRKKGNQCYKEIVDRFIKSMRNSGSKYSRLTRIHIYNTISERSFCGDDVFSRKLCKYLIESIEWECFFLFRSESECLTKIRCCSSNITYRIWVHRDRNIGTCIHGDGPRRMIYEFNFRDIWNRDIFFLYLKYDSLSSHRIFCCIFRKEKILYNQWKCKGVEKYEKNTRIHKKRARKSRC